MRRLIVTPAFDRDWKHCTSDVKEKVLPHLLSLREVRLPSREQDIRKLSGITPPAFRLRVGDYRVIFTIDATTITLLSIGHRKDIYR